MAVLNDYENLRSDTEFMRRQGQPPKYWGPGVVPAQLVASMDELVLAQIHGVVKAVVEAAGTRLLNDPYTNAPSAEEKS